MSPELKKIWRFSLKATGLFLLIGLIVCVLFFRSMFLSVFLGLVWGEAVALMGLYLICTLAMGLSDSVKEQKNRGRASYVLRYLLYAVCLFAGAWLHLNVFAMLCGILAQKGSLVWFALREGKDSR